MLVNLSLFNLLSLLLTVDVSQSQSEFTMNLIELIPFDSYTYPQYCLLRIPAVGFYILEQTFLEVKRGSSKCENCYAK